MKQEFWNKWSNDYITQLQLRSKWKCVQENLAVGDMVLVKEENTAPLHWPLGRVMQIYPGKDGLVRVVQVLMKGRLFKRPIVKLAPLPKKSHNLEEDIDFAIKENEKILKNGEISIENTRKRKIENILDDEPLKKKLKITDSGDKTKKIRKKFQKK